MTQTRHLFVSLSSVLLGFGLLMVHSASITSWPTEFEQVYLSRHAVFLLIGVIAGCVCAALPARFWFYAAPYLFAATVLLLIALLIPGVGTNVNGATRWLRYGSISVQPSEIAKVTLPLIVAVLVVRHRDNMQRWIHGTVPFLVPILIVMPLVFKQPDFGTTVFLLIGVSITLFLAGWPIRNFVLGTSATIASLGYLVAMRPYQMQRIQGFLDTWSDINQAPYQVKQALVTLGAGGTLGVGLGKGWQKLSFLPEANTDFVFAVVGEELGLVGTLGLVALWAGLYVTGLTLFRSVPRQSFAYIVGITLLTQLVLQAAINMAVVTSMVPNKGIPHPMISYGGSSLVMTLVSLGIIVGLSKAKPLEDDIVLA